jgi:3-phosphoshikimate 1-carboxyvinyltransferase
MKIIPAKSIVGEIRLPGDKSISHRAAIISAMAEGETVISNFSASLDCDATLDCLSKLGIQLSRSGADVKLNGSGFKRPQGSLNCGNSGTTMRLLAGVLAAQNFDCVLKGDDSLTKRPMERVITPLKKMGAGISSEGGNPPIRISGRSPLNAISCTLPVASAQLKSAILLAGMNAVGVTKVLGPPSDDAVSLTRDHTELMLRYLGTSVDERFIKTERGFVQEISVDGSSELTARDIHVPGDISSAAFFAVAASVLPDSDILMRNVGLNPTRTAFIDLLMDCGANIKSVDNRKLNGEDFGDLRVSESGPLEYDRIPSKIPIDIVPKIIDEIPVLAVLGTQMEGGLEIRGAGELRLKESDRIEAVIKNLKRMNADITGFSDGFRVGQSELNGAVVDSFGDHRIAMAFAIAGLFATEPTEIVDSGCVDVSFPDFFKVLANVVK